MNVIRFNWKLINKLILFIVIIILFYELYDLFIKLRPALEYDNEKRLFFMKSKESLNVYKSVQIKCVHLHYTHLNLHDLPFLLNSIVDLNFNCVRLQLLWNVHENEEGQIRFIDNKNNVDLKTIIELVNNSRLNLILKIGAYHRYDSYSDFGGLPSWLLSNNLTNNLDLDLNKHLFNSYKTYLGTLFSFLGDNKFFYDYNGPLIGFECDYIENNSTLTQQYYDFYKDLMYTHSINELLLVSITTTVSFNTNIYIYMPLDVYLAEQAQKFDKFQYNNDNNLLYLNETIDQNANNIDLGHANRQILLLNHLNGKSKSYLLNNFNCFYTYGLQNGANLIYSDKNHLVYRPISSYINIKNCLIDYNMKLNSSLILILNI